jgi:zinc and cadmium transporter
MVAVLALSIHSLFDGIALGAAAHHIDGGPSLVLSVFLSVLIHKPMDGLSVSVLLMQAGVQRRTLWIVQIVYAALVPVGAIGFHLFEQSLADASTLVGYTLAFSGGTFLAIALTDLLPELHFHTHDRNKLSAALLLGLFVMWLTSTIGHGEHAHDQPAPAAQPADAHNHDGHEGHEH